MTDDTITNARRAAWALEALAHFVELTQVDCAEQVRFRALLPSSKADAFMAHE